MAKDTPEQTGPPTEAPAKTKTKAKPKATKKPTAAAGTVVCNNRRCQSTNVIPTRQHGAVSWFRCIDCHRLFYVT